MRELTALTVKHEVIWREPELSDEGTQIIRRHTDIKIGTQKLTPAQHANEAWKKVNRLLREVGYIGWVDGVDTLAETPEPSSKRECPDCEGRGFLPTTTIECGKCGGDGVDKRFVVTPGSAQQILDGLDATPEEVARVKSIADQLDGKFPKNLIAAGNVEYDLPSNPSLAAAGTTLWQAKLGSALQPREQAEEYLRRFLQDCGWNKNNTTIIVENNAFGKNVHLVSIVALTESYDIKRLNQTKGSFKRGDDPANENCLDCGKHIRDHYDDTRYRCVPGT